VSPGNFTITDAIEKNHSKAKLLTHHLHSTHAPAYALFLTIFPIYTVLGAKALEENNNEVKPRSRTGSNMPHLELSKFVDSDKVITNGNTNPAYDARYRETLAKSNWLKL